ncbi:DUF4136 domain-containing protein [Trinickia dinghuensis]|uniref:DUF4136 domain-containing protein n=1 Tax=Trinickia dinghuensis TaxID=2291023 RepID=A0A3D8JVK6_9BURK|nr:DUF4136 domain-containing protein [Trinickia dinghuensis]RDU96832.1 DUF4136 domain-containing protein [Trinickia dinghuensis]
MKKILLLAACAAALTGCAGTRTAVRASSGDAFGNGARTYALASDSAASDDESRRYASAIERRLTELGFAAEPEKTARYRVELAHETRPASVGIGYTHCADDVPCGAAVLPAGFEWPGTTTYVHSLTLRFFDHADGRETYKVSATKRDRDPGAARDIDDLVASALARLPFAPTGARNGPTDWKVTLRQAGTDAVPRVMGIAPLK